MFWVLMKAKGSPFTSLSLLKEDRLGKTEGWGKQIGILAKELESKGPLASSEKVCECFLLHFFSGCGPFKLSVWSRNPSVSQAYSDKAVMVCAQFKSGSVGSLILGYVWLTEPGKTMYFIWT